MRDMTLPEKAILIVMILAVAAFGVVKADERGYFDYKTVITEYVHDNQTTNQTNSTGPIPTITVTASQSLTTTITTTATATVTVAPPPPKQEDKYEDPKYRLHWDFEVRVEYSTVPLVNVPWTGTGAVFVIVYFEPNQFGYSINDTGMKLAAYLYVNGWVGSNFCGGAIVLTNWTAIPKTPTTPLAYQSMPIPQNPYNLFGSGDNCYTRVFVESLWYVSVWGEGDGEVKPMWIETTKDNRTIRHLDTPDWYWIEYYRFKP